MEQKRKGIKTKRMQIWNMLKFWNRGWISKSGHQAPVSHCTKWRLEVWKPNVCSGIRN